MPMLGEPIAFRTPEGMCGYCSSDPAVCGCDQWLALGLRPAGLLIPLRHDETLAAVPRQRDHPRPAGPAPERTRPHG